MHVCTAYTCIAASGDNQILMDAQARCWYKLIPTMSNVNFFELESYPRCRVDFSVCSAASGVFPCFWGISEALHWVDITAFNPRI